MSAPHELIPADAFEPWDRCTDCYDEHGNERSWPCEVVRLRTENQWLRNIARLAGDFRDQIHPDVVWDRVPPWTMDVVHALDKAIEAFDKDDDPTG